MGGKHQQRGELGADTDSPNCQADCTTLSYTISPMQSPVGNGDVAQLQNALLGALEGWGRSTLSVPEEICAQTQGLRLNDERLAADVPMEMTLQTKSRGGGDTLCSVRTDWDLSD